MFYDYSEPGARNGCSVDKVQIVCLGPGEVGKFSSRMGFASRHAPEVHRKNAG